MCFNQKGDIFTVNGGSLKLVDKFMSLGSSISSTKIDINMWLAKAGTAIDRLSIIQKWNLSDNFFPSGGCVESTMWMNYMDADYAQREKNLTGIAQACNES